MDKDEWFIFESENARPTRSNTKGEAAIGKTWVSTEFLHLQNEIPDWVKDKESVNAFKNAYDKWASQQYRHREDGENKLET